jgi:pyruvate dehydrogenase E2 component (dihydrolipoamide acetyltransferase)
MQEEGFVAKLLYPAGAKDVKLGELIAIVVEKESDIAAFANYTAGSQPQAAAQPAAKASEPAKPKAAAKSYPDHVVLEMPNLSPTMEKVPTILL